MPEQFVSGSEITNNPGNAALGYSSGVEYNANPADTNPFQGIQSTLTTLQAQHENRRLLDRQQKLKQQEDFAKYLSDSDEHLFNIPGEGGRNTGLEILPGDSEALLGKTDDLRRHQRSKWQTWQWDPEIRNKNAHLRQLRNLATIRSRDVAQKRVQLANENDPAERAKIQASIDKTMNEPLSEATMPEPYLPPVSGSITKIGIDKDVLSGTKKDVMDDVVVSSRVDNDGNEVVTTRSLVRPSALDPRGKLTPGTEEFKEAFNLVRRYYNDPSFMNVQHIQDMNQAVDEYNAHFGLSGSGAAQHIAEAMPNGQIVGKPLNAKNIGDIAYALAIEHAGKMGSNKEIKRTSTQIADDKTKINLAKAESKRQESELNLAWKKFENDKNKLSKEEREQEKEKLESRNVATTVYKTLANSSAGRPLVDVIAKVPEADKAGLIQTVSSSGIDLDNYNVSALNSADATVKNIAGVQYVNQQGQLQKGVARPTYAYVAKPKSGNMSDAKFVIGYPDMEDVVYPPDSDKAGQVQMGTDGKPKKKKVTNWKVISPQEAIGSYISARSNFSNITAPMQARMDASSDLLTEMMGGTTPASQPTEKIIKSDAKGNKYEQINGKWYPVQ